MQPFNIVCFMKLLLPKLKMQPPQPVRILTSNKIKYLLLPQKIHFEKTRYQKIYP